MVKKTRKLSLLVNATLNFMRFGEDEEAKWTKVS
jgi:hypothetical protein